MSFTRDRVFWTASLQTTVVAFFMGGFGPAQTLLREDQGTSLTVAGLHGTMVGVASIIAGYLNSPIAHHFGRKKAGWLGLVIASIGVLILALAKPVTVTIPATLIAGIGTSIVINNMVTTLSVHYREKATIALPQSNAVSVLGFLSGTFFISTLAGLIEGGAWRLGLLLVIPMALVLFYFTKDVGEEHVKDVDGRQRGKLGAKYWVAWVGLFTSIATEFATTFWAAALLFDRLGITSAAATACVMAFSLGMGIGRWYGQIWLRRLSLDQQFFAMLSSQFVGFGLFWFSHSVPLSVISLFIMGLGVSSQFPLHTVRLIRFSAKRPDLAIGYSSLAAGLAIAVAPFMLALLGDHIGISKAYIMVPLLIAAAIANIFFLPTPKEEHV